MNNPTTFEWVTFTLGTTGAVLGIIATVRSLASTRVRLKIKSYPLTIHEGNDEFVQYACVEIANTGSFPVTIKEVSFEKKGQFTISDFLKRCIDKKPLPRRLDSRDSIQVCFPNLETTQKQIDTSDRILVETACGTRRYGSLKEWRKIRERESSSKKTTTNPII